MLKYIIKTVSDFVEYMEHKYPWNERSIYQSFMKSEEEFKFFVSVIKNCIEKSDLSDEDKLYTRRYFDMMNCEFWDTLQKQKEEYLHPKAPKYSAEQAFDIIRTMNCSLEDKLKVAELFEYMGR